MKYKEELKKRIRVAMGQEPADIVFVNGKLVSTFTEEIIEAPLAVCAGRIAAVDHVADAKQVIDLKGAYLCPSLIDAHIHIESSMLTPEGFAEVVVPCGTSAVVSDPHEIVNVFGLKGLEFMLAAAKNLPLDIHYGIPSCVPATNMETAGGEIHAEDIEKAFRLNPDTPVLSEMMNYPGVFLCVDEVIDKICKAKELGLAVDGHSPMLTGKELNAYLNADILTDHECATEEEAMAKLQRGMFVLIREGSAARNLKDLAHIITDKTAHRICVASDDRHPDDLAHYGHLDHTLRELIKHGIEPIRAIRLLSLNPASVYRLEGRGGLGIGYRADMFIVEDLQKPVVREVYHKGIKVAEKGELLHLPERISIAEVTDSVTVPEDLEQKLRLYPSKGAVQVIGVIDGQLVTEKLKGKAEDVAEGDLAYLAVVERHGKNGNVGLGFVKGLGIKDGALASTVAHDHHNLILAGKTIEDMIVAAKAAKDMGGGFVLVKDRQVKASVALPVAGIMSDRKAGEVAQSLQGMDGALKEMGVELHSPFMVLSFLALSVIPHLKLTDKGLIDVDHFELTSLVL